MREPAGRRDVRPQVLRPSRARRPARLCPAGLSRHAVSPSLTVTGTHAVCRDYSHLPRAPGGHRSGLMVSISQGSGLLVRLRSRGLYRPGRGLVPPCLLVLLRVLHRHLDDARRVVDGRVHHVQTHVLVASVDDVVPGAGGDLSAPAVLDVELEAQVVLCRPHGDVALPRVQPYELVRLRVCLEPDEGAWRDRHQGHLKVSTRPSNHVLGRAMYAGERIGVTGNGKLAAVVIGVEDLEALEEFEMAQDLAAYREAKAADDGGRVTLDELRRGLGQ